MRKKKAQWTLLAVALAVLLGLVGGRIQHWRQEVKGSRQGGLNVGHGDQPDLENGFSLNLQRFNRETTPKGIPSTTSAFLMRSPYVDDGPWIDFKGIEPGTEIECPSTGKTIVVPGDPEIAILSKKLEELVILKVEMSDWSLDEAISYLVEQSRKLDATKAGVGIHIENRGWITEETRDEISITLSLKEVPLVEALRYVTELAGMRYRLSAGGVFLEPHVDFEDSRPLETRTYKMPTAFTQLELFDSDEDYEPEFPSSLEKPSAQEILLSRGFMMLEDSSVQFDEVSNRLVFRNTPDQHELMEAFIESLQQPKEVEIGGGFIESSRPFLDSRLLD